MYKSGDRVISPSLFKSFIPIILIIIGIILFGYYVGKDSPLFRAKSHSEDDNKNVIKTDVKKVNSTDLKKAPDLFSKKEKIIVDDDDVDTSVTFAKIVIWKCYNHFTVYTQNSNFSLELSYSLLPYVKKRFIYKVLTVDKYDIGYSVMQVELKNTFFSFFGVKQNPDKGFDGNKVSFDVSPKK
jgi:hypothetical protein